MQEEENSWLRKPIEANAQRAQVKTFHDKITSSSVGPSSGSSTEDVNGQLVMNMRAALPISALEIDPDTQDATIIYHGEPTERDDSISHEKAFYVWAEKPKFVELI